MSRTRSAVAAALWSLPLGLAEGHRAVQLSLRHNSLFGDGHLRSLAVGAALVVCHLAAFFLLALAAGAAGRLLERAGLGPASRVRDGAIFAALLAGLATFPDPLRSSTAGWAMQVATLAALAAAGFLVWRRAVRRAGDAPGKAADPEAAREALRAPGSLLLGGAILLVSLALMMSGLLTRWPGSLAAAGLAGFVLWAARAGWRRPLRTAALVCAPFSVLWIAGGLLPPVAPARGGPGAAPAVILVTVDTLRADALSCYRPGGGGTPSLDRLAADGVLFEHAYAPAPWTIPSVYALLTSKLPHEIGMTGSAGAARLADDVPRLPEFLPAAYESRAVVTNVFGARHLGSWKGFDQVESADIAGSLDALRRVPVLPRALLGRRPFRYPFTAARAGRVVDRAIAHLEALAGTPFLLWVHLYDPHSPYDPPPPFDAGAAEFPTRLAGIRTRSLMHLRAGSKLDASDRAHVRALYDGEVRYTDAQIGRLRAALERLGIWEDALVIVASDHGEEFWEHGSVEHGHTLYEELLRVPLLVKLPGGRGAGLRVAEPASILDILPTILEVTGAAPADELRGRSLLPMVEPDDSAAEAAPGGGPRPLYFEGVIHFRERKGILDGRWKLILDPEENRAELYDLVEDPGEVVNLAPLEPDRTAALRDAIAPFLAAEAAATREPIDPELRDRLRALGYLQ